MVWISGVNKDGPVEILKWVLVPRSPINIYGLISRDSQSSLEDLVTIIPPGIVVDIGGDTPIRPNAVGKAGPDIDKILSSEALILKNVVDSTEATFASTLPFKVGIQIGLKW